MRVKLRDYQDEMICGARDSLGRVRRVLLQAPTGAGKTALASFMAGETAAGGRTVWFICHRDELVAGTSNTFRKFGIPHGIIASGHRIDTRHRVQVCSIGTLKNRLHQLPPPALIIWDECHHMGATGWQAVMAHYSQARHVGLSATPTRLDGRGLGEFFQEMVLGPTVAWLIEQGHLSDYRAFAPSKPDLRGIRKQAGDFARGQAADAMDKPKLTGDAITHWLKYASGMRSVGFAVNVAHSRSLAAQFNAAGIRAAHLDGTTPKDERKRIIGQFADGIIPMLFNVDLFGEGFDLSAVAEREVTIDCAMLLRPTQSLALHLQQIGRALRPAPGKVAVILDHAGNIDRHGLPDDEREWSLEGVESKGRGGANDNGPPPPITCGCFFQMRRPAPEHCPNCGAPTAPEVKEIKVAEGELEEITPSERRAKRADQLREQERCETLGQLVQLANGRGYKSPQQWAFKVWTARQAKRRARSAA